MKNGLLVLLCAVALIFPDLVRAAEMKNNAPDESDNIKEVVYLVLMSQSPPLHLIEMPNMEKCQAAASNTENAKCITTKALGVNALKAKIGGFGHLRRLPARVPPKE